MRSQVASTFKAYTDMTIFKITRVDPEATEQGFGFVPSQHPSAGRYRRQNGFHHGLGTLTP